MCRFIATSIYVKSSHNHDILPAPLQQKHPPTHPPTLIPNLHLHEVQSNCLAYFIWITTNNISTDGFGTLPYKYGTLNLRPPTLKHEKASHVFHRANQNKLTSNIWRSIGWEIVSCTYTRSNFVSESVHFHANHVLRTVQGRISGDILAGFTLVYFFAFGCLCLCIMWCSMEHPNTFANIRYHFLPLH